jgi:RNA polymerase sigma-70 factor (ECF subfamily)
MFQINRLTEKELIKGCIRGDINCQHMLFKKYAGILMTICLRYSGNKQEAEDMLQEAFIRVFSFIGQYKFSGSLEGWLKRITINSALRILESKKIHFFELREEEQQFYTIETDMLSRLSKEELLNLISNLPEGYRIVFNLYVMEGYDHKEIAEILHIKEATSRSQLSKAKALLKEKINSFQKLPIKHD